MGVEGYHRVASLKEFWWKTPVDVILIRILSLEQKSLEIYVKVLCLHLFWINLYILNIACTYSWIKIGVLTGIFSSQDFKTAPLLPKNVWNSIIGWLKLKLEIKISSIEFFCQLDSISISDPEPGLHLCEPIIIIEQPLKNIVALSLSFAFTVFTQGALAWEIPLLTWQLVAPTRVLDGDGRRDGGAAQQVHWLGDAVQAFLVLWAAVARRLFFLALWLLVWVVFRLLLAWLAWIASWLLIGILRFLFAFLTAVTCWLLIMVFASWLLVLVFANWLFVARVSSLSWVPPTPGTISLKDFRSIVCLKDGHLILSTKSTWRGSARSSVYQG